MSLLVWDAKYNLDIAEIDRQHQRLFALFNELYEAMQEGHGSDVVGQVLTNVVDYTVYHFAHEEQLLRQHGYADEASHRAEHARLTQQAKTLAAKLRGGEGQVALATLKFLSDWLNHHILETDRRFAGYLRERGVR